MSDIRYVVTSLPRSGTKYISKVLNHFGFECGHEAHFNLGKCRTSDDREGIWGDASWMAAPYISELPPGTIVFHQLRDPLKVLNSNLPPGGDSYFRTWDENAGLDTDPLYEKSIPWKRFIWEHTNKWRWAWPEGVGEGPESPEEVARLVHWWTNWNLKIEYAATQRSDLRYIRYRLEDMSPDLIRSIAHVIAGTKVPPRLRWCEEVLKKVPTTTNRHRTPNTRITLDMLPATARLLMHAYGYYDTI